MHVVPRREAEISTPADYCVVIFSVMDEFGSLQNALQAFSVSQVYIACIF